MSDPARVDGRNWIIDSIVGVFCGGIVGATVAVNVVIYAGPDTGYESSIVDVFRHNAVTGVAAVFALLAGPVLGVVMTRGFRHRRSER